MTLFRRGTGPALIHETSRASRVSGARLPEGGMTFSQIIQRINHAKRNGINAVDADSCGGAMSFCVLRPRLGDAKGKGMDTPVMPR